MHNMSVIGFTCSAFDLFHAGHVTMLAECKQHCDYLIVGLQVDPKKDRPEKNSPVQSVYERYVQLRGCIYVDEIIPYETEQDLENLLAIEDIHVRFLGKEYENKSGYTAYDMWLPKAENNKYAYGEEGSERILKYDEAKHLKKLEVKPVDNFGDDDDDFSTPPRTSSDFNLD